MVRPLLQAALCTSSCPLPAGEQAALNPVPGQTSKRMKPVPGEVILFLEMPTWWQAYIAG